jgi:hypothetical protein
MSDYSEFFLKTPANIVMLELIELSHPDFTKTYRLVRNATNGVTVTLETAASATFEYYPLKINKGDTRENLDQSITLTFGDLGEVLPNELDVVLEANNFVTKPILKYRIYRSDDLTAPLEVITLEVQSISFQKIGAVIEARSKALNINKTGEIYTIDRFPMLKGFL